MDFMDIVTHKLGWMPPKVIAALEKRLKHIPFVQAQIQKEYNQLFEGAEAALKPYRGGFPTFSHCTTNTNRYNDRGNGVAA